MKAVLFALAMLSTSTLSAQTPSPQGPNIPKGMKQYFIGFLVQGEKWAQTPPKEELDELMQKHLGYIRSQADAGKYALAGPFLDNGFIRGMLIINAASVDEAKQIASGDPMVKSGRMAVEMHPAMFADVSCVLIDYAKNGGK